MVKKIFSSFTKKIDIKYKNNIGFLFILLLFALVGGMIFFQYREGATTSRNKAARVAFAKKEEEKRAKASNKKENGITNPGANTLLH